MIAIIDYKMGNLKSVYKAFEKCGAKVVITNDAKTIQESSKIVLPGVGAFGDGITNLKNLGLVDILTQEVIENKKYFLGICLGMQLVATKGTENGNFDGLDWIDGEVIKFDFSKENKNLKTPHVGWNNVSYTKNDLLFDGIDDCSDFYFVHSYHFCANEDVVLSTTDYGMDFVSSIKKENIYACQFHPEKSQQVGLQLISNFIKL